MKDNTIPTMEEMIEILGDDITPSLEDIPTWEDMLELLGEDIPTWEDIGLTGKEYNEIAKGI